MKTFRFVAWYVVLTFVMLVILSTPLPAKAGGTIGDGTPGSCTEAAFEAALVGGGRVSFNCGPDPYTLTLTSQKTISANTTIDGGNLISLSGGDTTRLFEINADVALKLQNLVVLGGNASQGGAILNHGELEISQVVFNKNSAPGALGGAIYNQGNLKIENSTFSNNFGGLTAGGIYNQGTAWLNATIFTGNQAQIAGAVYNNGTMTIYGSIFDNNTTTGGGGAGIYNDHNLTIFTSTFSNNKTNTSQYGGGLYNVIGGVAVVIRSSFINNSATGGLGGGIYNAGQLTILRDLFWGNNSAAGIGGGLNSNSTDPLTIIDTTFSGNFGGFGGGGLVVNGPASILNSTITGNTPDGLANGGTDTVSIKNTVLSGNGSTNCNGVITSLGHNLEDGTTCALSGTGDQSSTDPMLGLLEDNGGPTFTHALLYGSPAINTGTNEGCPPADQRGVMRPLLGTCDIGAYEFGFVIQLPMVRK